MKTAWKGSISFGLVSISVRLSAAIEPHSIEFTLLHATCHTPLHYQRWCEHCHEVVEWPAVVKGIATSKGTYRAFTQEQLKMLKPAASETIALTEFIDAESLQPLYFNNHYYVYPARPNDKAYSLFVRALQQLHKVAIGTVVFKDKGHIIALQPYEQGLLATTLHFAYEVRPYAPHTLVPTVTKELKLAEQLIEKLSAKSFKIEKYKDPFAQELKAVLQHKRSLIPSKGLKKRATKPSLMQSLQASLSTSKKRRIAK